MSRDSQITPFPGLPRLGEMNFESGAGISQPLFVDDHEMAHMLEELPTRKRMPNWSSGLDFHPFEDGFVGMPFCQSGDPEVTCYPVGPGPDDDPRGFSCVCFGPRPEHDRPRPSGPVTPMLELCSVGLVQTGNRFRLGCIAKACARRCSMARFHRRGTWSIGCTCS